MKIRIIKTTVLEGRFVKAGEIVEASDAHANTLIGYGKAEAIVEGDLPKVEELQEPASEPVKALTTEEVPTVKTTRKRVKRG